MRKREQLSLLNIVTLVVLDSCHFSIHRGSTYWSPGYGIMLMAVARVSIIAFMADLWIVGYSIAFVVYGGALVREASSNRSVHTLRVWSEMAMCILSKRTGESSATELRLRAISGRGKAYGL